RSWRPRACSDAAGPRVRAGPGARGSGPAGGSAWLVAELEQRVAVVAGADAVEAAALVEPPGGLVGRGVGDEHALVARAEPGDGLQGGPLAVAAALVGHVDQGVDHLAGAGHGAGEGLALVVLAVGDGADGPVDLVDLDEPE